MITTKEQREYWRALVNQDGWILPNFTIRDILDDFAEIEETEVVKRTKP